MKADEERHVRSCETYEPESEDEPAHYAQGQLHLPKGFSQLIIRFRIALPGLASELTRDITIDIDEH